MGSSTWPVPGWETQNLKFELMKSEENKCEKAKNVVYNEVLL